MTTCEFCGSSKKLYHIIRNNKIHFVCIKHIDEIKDDKDNYL